MLAASGICRRQNAVALPFLLPKGVESRRASATRQLGVRTYAQKRSARTPQSVPQQSTTNPSPTSQVKNRDTSTFGNAASAGASTSSAKKVSSPIVASGKVGKVAAGARPGLPSSTDAKIFAKMRQTDFAREMERQGSQLDIVRMSMAAGHYPWDEKTELMDLRIPEKGFRGWSDNLKNNIQNMISMYRLAEDYAFPGIPTNYRLHPQIFRAKSTSDKAWVLPYRKELWDIYVRVNRALTTCDRGVISRYTSYEYREHATTLLNKNVDIFKRHLPTYTRKGELPSRYFEWNMHTEWSTTAPPSSQQKRQSLVVKPPPVQILSLRAFPLYSAPKEPNYGNRNCVQALVKFDTIQSLTMRDAKTKEVISPDGKSIEKERFDEMVREAMDKARKGLPINGSGEEVGWNPVKRVVEYLVFENKMFYPDGWYIRDQVYESVKPRFRSFDV